MSVEVVGGRVDLDGDLAFSGSRALELVDLFDDEGVGELAASSEALAEQLVGLYPLAVDSVYGYLLARCGDAELAEDLTSEAFMEAVAAVEGQSVDVMTTGWLIVVARRRLVDHWRREERRERKLQLLQGSEHSADDPWEQSLDVAAVRAALASVTAQHRAVLTLRYLDGLSVPEVASLLGRTVHAAESLLQRARAALRRAYDQGDADAE